MRLYTVIAVHKFSALKVDGKPLIMPEGEEMPIGFMPVFKDQRSAELHKIQFDIPDADIVIMDQGKPPTEEEQRPEGLPGTPEGEEIPQEEPTGIRRIK